MQNVDLAQETYPYINLWLHQHNEVDIFWDEETKSLVRIYVDEAIYWKSDAEVHSLDKALKALDEFLGDTIFSEAEDFTEGWEHND
jgi:hypothetical protein